MIDIRIQAGGFDPGRQIVRLEKLNVAGVASVTGLVEAAPDVAAVLVDHYPALAKAELARIAEEAQAQWPLAGLILIHRHGRLSPGDRVLFVGAAACERAAAIEACAFLADALRARAPFWRKDLLADGSGRWV